jgi:FkbM family methyltransferase
MFSGPVKTKIHDRRVILNFGHTYPVYSRRLSTLNNPLVQLVHQVHATKGSPISFVDVGANIGDSIVLLDSNCPGALGETHCIEGDPGFFGYLKNNLRSRENTRLYLNLLSSAEGSEKGLVRRLGTASAEGADDVASVPLDSLLLMPETQSVDVLKSDVDGFDGKVLQGAVGVLRRFRPAVIFEWHPILYERTGNDWRVPFEVLGQCGYTKFAWFTKMGAFSHFTGSADWAGFSMLADLCLRSGTFVDWHYDIIALHDEAPIAPIELAEQAFARAKVSPF